MYTDMDDFLLMKINLIIKKLQFKMYVIFKFIKSQNIIKAINTNKNNRINKYICLQPL